MISAELLELAVAVATSRPDRAVPFEEPLWKATEGGGLEPANAGARAAINARRLAQALIEANDELRVLHMRIVRQSRPCPAAKGDAMIWPTANGGIQCDGCTARDARIEALEELIYHAAVLKWTAAMDLAAASAWEKAARALLPRKASNG